MNAFLPHLAARIFDVPLLIDASKAAAIASAIGGRIVPGGFEISGVEPADHRAFEGGRAALGTLSDKLGRRIEQQGAGEIILDVVRNVAVIAVEGTLVHKGKWLNSYSGETSYEGLQTQIARARGRADIKGVVLELDSFGGEGAGAFDTAQMIADLSAEKPTLAILNDFALSAGYLLASAARQIVMPPLGAAGSIGVITLHADYSKQLEDRGVKVTLLTAGKHKADGHPFGPLPHEVAERILGELEAARQNFAETVSSFRGTRLSKDAALSTEARIYRGEDAVQLGLVDGVMRPSEAFSAFVEEVNRARRP